MVGKAFRIMQLEASMRYVNLKWITTPVCLKGILVVVLMIRANMAILLSNSAFGRMRTAAWPRGSAHSPLLELLCHVGLRGTITVCLSIFLAAAWLPVYECSAFHILYYLPTFIRVNCLGDQNQNQTEAPKSIVD